jgi:NAD(P)-dependent dehydrogenase (short-subunit alcohol dehydrogenase family)
VTVRRFENKVVLVTGAASGIGQAAARLFAMEGARVVASTLAQADCQQTVGQLQAAGGAHAVIEADVSKAQDCARLVSGAVEQFGRIDVAFNNAGIPDSGQLAADVDEAEWERVLRVNLTGVFLMMKYEIQAMRASGGGVIVNTASLAGVLAAPRSGAYVAAKHGVMGLTKAAALDHIAEGIRINALCPGATDTAMLHGVIADAEVKAHLLGSIPIKRVATAEEIARAALFLASDEASYLVGHGLIVDGGVAAH